MTWVVYVSDTDIPPMPIFSAASVTEAQARAELVRESAHKNRRRGIRVEIRWEGAGGVPRPDLAANG